MLTINETLLNRLSSIEDKQMSCYINAEVWILTHWSLTYFIELTFLYIYLILSCILFVLLVYNPNWIRLFDNIFQSYYLRLHHEEDEKERIFLYAIGVLIKETILISIYVFFAFIYNWFVLVHDKVEITSMKFYQWLVEASYIPIVLSSTYCFGTIDNFVRQYRLFALVAILIKVPLFVLMRYAETENNFFINNLKADFFYTWC
jgi:hypothetical protein